MRGGGATAAAVPSEEGRKTGMARMVPGAPGPSEHPDAKRGLCLVQLNLSYLMAKTNRDY